MQTKTRAPVSKEELAGCKLSSLSGAEERRAQGNTNLSMPLDASRPLIRSMMTREKSGQSGSSDQPRQCYP